MIKSAENMNIETLFGKDRNGNEHYYAIPPYQREYAWKKEQWENLFTDLEENDAGYFLGSLICIKENTTDTYLVIDGQQRLTTLSILMNAIFKIINTEAKQNRQIIDAIDNENQLALYLQLKNMIFKGKLKLHLSIQNYNDKDYKYLCHENGFKEDNKNVKTPNYGNRRISKAFKYFIDRFKDYTIDKMFNFLEKLNSALVVRIDVQDATSAFILFESINNRGIPLSPIDLIKNSIIGHIKNQTAEKSNEKWQTIVDNIENFVDQVRFLRHYYHAFQNDSKVKISGFTKATKSNIIKIYEEHIVKKDVNFIFNELVDKSTVYKKFVNPESLEEKDSYKIILINMDKLGVAPSYALLLNIFVRYEEKDLLPILKLLEKWFIRRHLTDYPGTNKLDQIFLDCIEKINDKEYDEILPILSLFLTQPNNFKNDEDFQNDLQTKAIYDLNTGATRYILIKLETSKRTKEENIDFWEVKNKKPIWSLEHILPQSPDKKSDWMNNFTEEQFESNIHRLGNLTLTAYNSSLSNKSFSLKRDAKDKDGKPIGLDSGNVKINDYIKNKDKDDVWNAECIKERGNILAEEIIELVKIV